MSGCGVSITDKIPLETLSSTPPNSMIFKIILNLFLITVWPGWANKTAAWNFSVFFSHFPNCVGCNSSMRNKNGVRQKDWYTTLYYTAFRG